MTKVTSKNVFTVLCFYVYMLGQLLVQCSSALSVLLALFCLITRVLLCFLSKSDDDAR